jgi:hypothetical protein
MPLTKAEARLEALKLAVRPGLERRDILDTAEEYYGFIVKDGNYEEPEAPKVKKAKP